MEQYDSRVDAYIEKSADFAKPILQHLRSLIHQVSPLITETIKWGFPFFEYKGFLCHISSFKQHCAFGLWNASLLKDPKGVIKKGEASAGSIGKITCFDDLPDDETLLDLIKEAMAINETGKKPAVIKKAPVPKPDIETPEYFIAVLNEHPRAKEIFEKFSPSHRREYLEWIIDAKTEVTRTKRMETAIEWLIEGKSRHWKYQ